MVAIKEDFYHEYEYQERGSAPIGSKLTGESLSHAVTIALQERLNRLRPQSSMSKRLRQIREECAPRLQGVPEHSVLLYDDHGLPA